MPTWRPQIKKWVSPQICGYPSPPSPRSRSRAKIHQISLEAAEILSVLFFFKGEKKKAQQAWIRAETESTLQEL